MKNRAIIVPALILLFASCSPTPATTPFLPTIIANSPTAMPATPIPQEINSTAIIPATPTVLSVSTSAAVWLQVLSPQDEDTVNTPQVDVIGSAPAGTVISINDDILIVGADAKFKSTQILDEGLNLIEIVASDDSGNETSLELTVTYEP